MPNQLSDTGLQVKTVTEITADLVAKLQAVYGANINVGQNTPDGQLINIIAQAAADNLELLELVYSSFSVDQAFGASLDRLVALNGLARLGGSFTMTFVTITVDRAITLAGLDAALADPNGTGFTVADNAGNQFILAATHVFGAAGSASLAFRAKKIGQVSTLPNTITNQITVTLGVTGVNNPLPATSVGTDEESDVALKLRHGQSFALASSGPADAILAAIRKIPQVTDAIVKENDTSGTVNGIAARTIWAIVENGTDAAVAAAIYQKKAPGVGMKGSTSVTLVRPSGDTIAIAFDRPVALNLYVKFSLLPRTTGALFDNTLIINALAAALVYKINQQATIGEVYQNLLAIAPQGIPTSVQVSKDGTNWFDNVTPTTFQNKFVADASRITIL